jgi:hypothetical protein
MELLLTVALVLMLISALVFNFTSLLRGNQLEEGTVRLETLMRFARAQAANSGRKVQLVFGPESTNAPAASTGEVRATWEPDPLGQPGCFSSLCDAQWHLQDINDLVHVDSVKVLDPTATKLSTNAADELDDESTNSISATAMAPINFYPDGSSDSAEIIVSAKSAEEDQRMAVRLVGITGSISHQLLTVDADEGWEDAATGERSSSLRRDPVVRDTTSLSDKPTRPTTSTPLASTPRTTQTPRTTVGETNTLDQIGE